MKKSFFHLLSWFLSLIALIVVVAIAYFVISSGTQGGYQGDNIQALEKRLAQLGIPVRSITVTKRSPLEIEVILQSSGSDGKLGRDDLWNKFLTEREVELAYLNFATRIDSYRLVLVTANGVNIYDSTIFLNPDLPSQKLTEAAPSPVENSEAKDILERSLDFKGLKLLALDVPASYTADDNSKLVTFDLSTGTGADKTDVAQIDEFIMNIRPQIEEINSRYDTRIALIHIQIKDSNNNLLVDYMEDIETGRQSSWTADNIEGNWYPQPAPVSSPNPQETFMPVALPTATSPQSVPLPTPITQPAAYPPLPTSPPYP